MAYINKNLNFILFILTVVLVLGFVLASTTYANKFKERNLEYNDKIDILSQKEQELQAKTNSLNSVLGQLSAKEAKELDLSSKFEDVREEKETLTQEKEQLLDTKQTLEQKIQSLNQRISDLDKQIQIKESEMKTLESRISDLNRALDVKDQEIRSLRDENARLKSQQGQ